MTAAVLTAADGDLPDIPGQPYVSPDDLASIGPMWSQAVQQQLVPVVAEVYQTSAGVVHAQMVDATQVPTLPSVGSLAAEQYLAAASNTFEQVGDDLWATARSELLDGFEKGESIDQLAARLRASAGMTAKKAVLVARTQVLDASNAGSIATARAAGIDMQKEWMSAEDLRVRPEHVLANGQKVDLNAKFTVGGYECDRPHDPTLPPALRYSCRCTTGYLIPEDSVDDAVDDAKPVPPIPGTSGVIEPLPDPYAGDLVSPALPGPDLGIPTVPGAGLTVRPALQTARTTTSVSRVLSTEYRRITGRDIDPNSLYFEGSVATAREHAEGVLRGLERFPDVPLERVVAFGTGNEYASATSRAIRFNQEWTSPAGRKRYLDALAQDAASGWHPPGSRSPIGIALHEFGHVLDAGKGIYPDLDGLLARAATARDVELAARRAAGELIDAADVAAGSGVDGLISREVSRYATKNREELVAEAFADVMTNGEAASQLSRDIFSLLEAEYRRTGGVVRAVTTEALPALPSPAAALASRTVPQLRALAKERGITIPAGSKKADIVRLLDEGPGLPSPGRILTPAEFDARATAALDGAQAEAAIPVHARITAPGSEPSTWRATGFNGAAADPEAVKAVTQYLRRPGAMNERLRFPDDPTHPLHEQTLDELLGYEPANPVLVAEAAAQADAQIAAIDRVMAQSLMPSESVTWRGVSMRALGDVPTDLVGYEWTDLGFVSTSTTRSVAENSFAGSGALLRIVVPEGTQALGFTGLGEAEMLLGRGLRYRIVADRGLTSEGARLLDVEIVPAGAAPAVAVPAVEVPLAKRTVAQLRALAADRKITVPKGAKKPDIVRLLETPTVAPVVRPVPAEFAARLQSARKSKSAMAQTEYRFSGNAQENADMFPDPEERRQVMDAFAGYRGIGSARTNKQLRDGGVVGPRVELMDRAFARSHLQDDVVVYRGSRGGIEFGSRETWADDLTGQEWTDRAYTSTSYDPTKARPFAADGVYMRIVAPRGTPAVGLRPAARIETGEAEILLGRGQRFRVVQDHGSSRPPGFDLPVDPDRPPILRFLDVEVVPVDSAAERAAVRALARETNTLIEQTSATARVLAEVDELLAKKASASTIREAIADALAEPGQLFAGADPAVLAALRAVASDPVKLRAAVTRLGGKAKIKPVSKAGAKVTFDADTMEGVGGIDIEAGARVTVVRRGSTVTLPDGTVMQLEKARVTPVTAPVKAAPVKRVPAATREPAATLLVRPSLANAKTVPDVAAAFRTEVTRLTGGRRVNFNPGPNASVDTAREHAEGVLRGLEVFPGTPPPAVGSVSRNLHPDSFFAATNPGEGIRFSDEVTSAAGRSEYLRAIREGRDSGFFVPGTDSPVAVAIHEFGHVVDNRLNKVVHARVDRAVKEYAERTGIPVSTAKREISGYATEGTGELIAESFADVLINRGSAKPLSKEIFEILRAEYSRRGLKLGRSLDLTSPRVTPVTAPVKAVKAAPVKRAPAAKKTPAAKAAPPVKAVPRGATPPARPVAYQLPPGVTEQDATALRLALKRRQPIEGMPGADNAGLVERLAVENNADRILGTFQDIVDPSRRMSTAQLQADLAARAKAAFADRAVATNVDNARLEEILTSGRFKTQFETGRSGGVFQPEERRLREEQWFGIPADATPETRPIYGYLVTSGDGKGMVDVYGGARIVFRSDVRDRTTAMVGDSMEHILTGRPAAVDDPDWYAFTVDYEDPLFAKLDRNYDGPAFNKKTYIEAQIHGGVTVDDIAEVIFTSRPSPELVALLRERGIPWRMRRR